MTHATGYDSDYQGARFYKCDLQMGTPGDTRHWSGKQQFATVQEAALAYARRCYEAGLEVVGITNHVFLDSAAFIPELRAAARELAPAFGYRLTVLPGWEVTVNSGMGIHLLALFDEDTPLGQVADVLTECGCPEPRETADGPRPANCTFEDVLRSVQHDARERGIHGIVIAAHPLGQNGMLNDKTQGFAFRRASFLNRDLLATEVPVPPDELPTPWRDRILQTALCEPEWRRDKRRLAAVMSSDTKALSMTDAPGNPPRNYIGSRWTWIRMSRPSIAALRQAFLDPESRIRFGPDRPDTMQKHPVIRRMEVKGASFLADQSLTLSRNLTTVIGGRGSGKSAVVEFLRTGLGHPPPAPSPTNEEALKQHQGLRKLLQPAGVLRTTVERDGKTWVVESVAGAAPQIVSGDPVEDFPRFFPVRVFSQKELAGIANDASALRALVDDTITSELSDLRRREDDLVREIRAINEKLGDHASLAERRTQLETEAKDLKLRLDTLAQQAAPLQAWRAVSLEENFVQRVRDEEARRVTTLRTIADDTASLATALPADIDSWPHAAAVKNIAAQVDASVEELKTALAAAVQAHEGRMRSILVEAEETKTWRQAVADARAAADAARAELEKKGVEAGAFEAYDRQYRERAAQLLDLKARTTASEELRAKRDGRPAADGRPAVKGLVPALREVWAAQTAARERERSRITEGIPPTAKGKPFAKVEIFPFEDRSAFASQFEALPWGRRVQGQARDQLWKALESHAGPHGHPGDVLVEWRAKLAQGQLPAGYPWPVADPKTPIFLQIVTEKLAQEWRLIRPADVVRIRLFRKSGDEVGLVPEAGSIGQKATAVLAVLLARGVEPLVIDQPEDDLDNAFLFHDLVPLLRDRKERRQLVIVTHNANIPVNGDAELVIALDGSSGRGTVRQDAAGRASVGALDRPEVVDAVSEVLEGSEEAFRRRREKYGY